MKNVFTGSNLLDFSRTKRNNIRFRFEHNLSHYFKRIWYALQNKQWKPVCCYVRSLDYSLAKDMARGLSNYIPRHEKMHVCNPTEIRDLKELLRLLETYGEWDDDLEHSPYTMDEINNLNYNRMMFLLKKYYRTLWL